MGVSWMLFGRLMDALGCLLGISWGSWVHLELSRLDLGSILEGLGRVWGGFGRVLGGFWPIFGWIWKDMGRNLGSNFKKSFERYGEEFQSQAQPSPVKGLRAQPCPASLARPSLAQPGLGQSPAQPCHPSPEHTRSHPNSLRCFHMLVFEFLCLQPPSGLGGIREA